jgi:site-specific recombinase XerD
VAQPAQEQLAAADQWVCSFLEYLAADRGASVYTRRNYRQALTEFHRWHQQERQQAPAWASLERDDFRSYLRHLGRSDLSRAAVRLRFSALRSFYKFLVRRGVLASTPIKNLALPGLGKRLPKFLTAEQMLALLAAPLKDLESQRQKSAGRRGQIKAPASQSIPGRQPTKAARRQESKFYRDAAILETIYSCGLRISELCGLTAEDMLWGEQAVCVRGKGKKERLVPIGAPALETIRLYWQKLPAVPGGRMPVFWAKANKPAPMSPRVVQLRLKRYLAIAGLDPGLTPHKLRHSYATHMLDAGADLRSVQELLGHAHLVSTQVYTHVTTERLKKAYDQAHPRA